MDGFAVLRQMREASPETPVVIITGYGSIESAVEAIKLGAFDYLTKPFTPEELRVVTRKAAANRSDDPGEHPPPPGAPDARDDFDQIIGQGKAMRSVLDIVARAALADSAVLITGESGTGKSSSPGRSMAGAGARPAPSSPWIAAALPEPRSRTSSSGPPRGPARLARGPARPVRAGPRRDDVPGRDLPARASGSRASSSG